MLSIHFKKAFKKNLWVRFQSTKPVLGRWTLEPSQQKLDRKVDLANEDHCGCCDDMKQKEEPVYFICGSNDVIDVSDHSSF